MLDDFIFKFYIIAIFPTKLSSLVENYFSFIFVKTHDRKFVMTESSKNFFKKAWFIILSEMNWNNWTSFIFYIKCSFMHSLFHSCRVSVIWLMMRQNHSTIIARWEHLTTRQMQQYSDLIHSKYMSMSYLNCKFLLFHFISIAFVWFVMFCH